MRIHGAKKRLLLTRDERAGAFWRKKREQSCPMVPAHSHFLQTFGQSLTRALQTLDGPASRDQVNDGDDQCDHQQEMNQTAGHVESPAQKPKDNEDCKNRPKHRYPFK